MNATIPADINTLDRLAAAQFYATTLGWAVHPLLAADRGEPQERGKKPLLKGWRTHTAAEISPDFLARYFGNGTNHNLGCVVRAPFVHVDLDSKPDAGASVQEWLATRPDLAAVPRERTGGGAHLAFICRDLPEDMVKAKKAPTCQINDKVSAELYLDGLNLVLSPSVHKSGHRYTWEVTGEIPEVKWADLCCWFGFAAPESKKRGRPGKEKPWWSRWDQDLRTLDLAGVMEDLGRLGACLDPDANKWSVRCPWEAQHSAGANDAPGSDTIIFNQVETMPGFKCLHSHCEARGIRDVVEWAEQQKPGIIAARCANLRVWQPGNTNAKGRPRIVLPSLGRPNGEFSRELGETIAPTLDMFRFSTNVVEVVTVPASDSAGSIPGHMLSTIKAAELVTAVERTVETGVLKEDVAGDEVFVPKSMCEQDARITLVSGFFGACLPLIRRVLDVPVPHLADDGKLVYPKPGYDARFGTWLNPHAPLLKTMGLTEALRWLLQDLFGLPEHGGFWWHDEQARVHALARFITPFCRGLMGWRRAPLWIFDGNREGCGKDTATATLRLLEFCRSMGVPHFVFASSSSVYGPDSPLPFTEDGPTDPCSPYALTKLIGEQWGRLYARLHDLRFVALRFFSVWGPGQRPDLALEAFTRRIVAGKSLIINGDGSQRRDLTHVSDVARAVELALRWPGPGAVVLNVGTGRNHSVLDMAKAAAKTATPPVEFQAAHPADVPETLASITAAGAQLGWQPRIFFPDGPNS